MPTLQELIDAARKEKDQLAERFGFNGPSSLDVVSAAAKRAASKKREASKANKRARESSEPMSPHRRSSRLSGAEPSPLSYGDVEDSDADSDDTDELELSLPRVRKPKVAKPSASASFTAPVSSALSGKEAALVELRMSLPKYPGRNNEAYNSLSFKGRISGCHWHRHKTVDLKPMCGLCAKPSNLYCADCLRSRFNMNAQTLAKHAPYHLCAVCRGDCNCGPCFKALKQGPTFSVYDDSQATGKTVQDYLRGNGIKLRQDCTGWAGPSRGQVWMWEMTPEQLTFVLKHHDLVVDEDEPGAPSSSAASAESYGSDSSSPSSSASLGAGASTSSSSSSVADSPLESSSSSSSPASSSAAPVSASSTPSAHVLARATRLVSEARAYYARLSTSDKAELAKLVDVGYTLGEAKRAWEACFDAHIAQHGLPEGCSDREEVLRFMQSTHRYKV